MSEVRELRWAYALPTGSFTMTMPEQPLCAEEVADLEAFFGLALRRLKRLVPREAAAGVLAADDREPDAVPADQHKGDDDDER